MVEKHLDQLDRAAGTAACLCMMNGDSLADKIRADQPNDSTHDLWEKFADLGFEKGMVHLAMQTVNKLKQDLASWRTYQLAVLRGEAIPQKNGCEIEHSVSALNYLLRTQSGMLTSFYSSEDEGSGAMQCVFPVLDELNTAWRQSFALWKTMMQILSVAASTGQLKVAA